MQYTDKELFNMLEKYRTDNDMSIRKICSELGVNPNTYTAWSKEGQISLKNRRGIATLFVGTQHSINDSFKNIGNKTNSDNINLANKPTNESGYARAIELETKFKKIKETLAMEIDAETKIKIIGMLIN